MLQGETTGFFLLSKKVSKHAKIVQTGQSADEIFASYHWFQKYAKIPSQTNPVDFYASNILESNLR